MLTDTMQFSHFSNVVAMFLTEMGLDFGIALDQAKVTSDLLADYKKTFWPGM